MKAFGTSILIEAPSAVVWTLLSDVAAWPRWNTTVSTVEGEVAPGAKVTVRTKAQPGRAFPVKVSALDAPRAMVWTGGMPLGLFTGTRTFRLDETGPGKTQFEMREVYAGFLAPLIVKSIPDLQPAFDEFARCLKRAAEATPRA